MAKDLTEYLDKLENHCGCGYYPKLTTACQMLRHVVTALELVADHTTLDQAALLAELDRMAQEAGE